MSGVVITGWRSRQAAPSRAAKPAANAASLAVQRAALRAALVVPQNISIASPRY